MLYLRVNKIRGQNYIYFLNWKQMKNFSQEMLHNKKKCIFAVSLVDGRNMVARHACEKGLHIKGPTPFASARRR